MAQIDSLFWTEKDENQEDDEITVIQRLNDISSVQVLLFTNELCSYLSQYIRGEESIKCMALSNADMSAVLEDKSYYFVTLLNWWV